MSAEFLTWTKVDFLTSLVIEFTRSHVESVLEGMSLALRYLGVGWYVALCIVIGVLGGRWIDGQAGTSPIFTLLGIVLGAIAASYGIYKMVRPLLRESETKED
jgi:F0F1-type ATP synthase assembly protein I